MKKKIKEMTYEEMLKEKENIIKIIKTTSSRYLKRDLQKCLDKINKELKEYNLWKSKTIQVIK